MGSYRHRHRRRRHHHHHPAYRVNKKNTFVHNGKSDWCHPIVQKTTTTIWSDSILNDIKRDLIEEKDQDWLYNCIVYILSLFNCDWLHLFFLIDLTITHLHTSYFNLNRYQPHTHTFNILYSTKIIDLQTKCISFFFSYLVLLENFINFCVW